MFCTFFGKSLVFYQKRCLKSTHVEGTVPCRHQNCFRNKISWKYDSKFINVLSVWTILVMLETARKIVDDTRMAFTTPYAEYVKALPLHMHAPKFPLNSTHFNRPPNRRFFVEGVAACHRHCKHMLSPIEYISLLIMGASRWFISR